MAISNWMAHPPVLLALLGLAVAGQPAQAQPACPTSPMRVTRSAGGMTDYLGNFPGIPDLCLLRRADGPGMFYLGLWRSDWPGAGDAYPAMRAVLHGRPGTRQSFITRSVPGLQWTDSFINMGPDTLSIAGRPYRTVKIAHEREGIEGNTYHSIITSWRDVATGATLKVVENQISGQSYGPDTTWTATAIGALP